MKTLMLTAEEEKLFSKFSQELRSGWEVVREEKTYEDSEDRREIRFQLLRLHDPSLRSFCEKAGQMKTPEDFAALAKSIDLQKVSNEELAQMFFALGPTVITAMAQAVLGVAVTHDDIEIAAALFVLRHEILDSFPSSVDVQ
jgi:hypothetical protein